VDQNTKAAKPIAITSDELIKQGEAFYGNLLLYRDSMRPTDGRLFYVADKNLTFTMKAHELGGQFTDIIAEGLSMSDFSDSVAGLKDDLVLETIADRCAKMVKEIKVRRGCLAYSAALKIYSRVQYLRKIGMEGIEEIYNQLKSRFKGSGRRKASAAPQPGYEETPESNPGISPLPA
jgi:hypothetical protein